MNLFGNNRNCGGDWLWIIIIAALIFFLCSDNSPFGISDKCCDPCDPCDPCCPKTEPCPPPCRHECC